MQLDVTRFKHKTQVRVRNYEIDWQGIVHNAVYLYYFEIGRIAYLEDLGVKIDLNSIQHDTKVVVARNEIDYLSSARFGDQIDVYTRISFIKNTSFAFEGILEDASSKRRIAENLSIHVWLNDKTSKPAIVGDDFRTRVRKLEGENVLISNPTLTV
jgi:acyl-CoA thioester hydrolase